MNCKEVARACSKMSGFITVTAQTVVLWVTTQRSLVDIHRHLEETFASILPFNHKDGGSMFL